MPRWYKFKSINPKLETNISFLNETKNKINKLFSDGLKIGDKAILKEHYEEKGFFKGFQFIVENFNNGLVNGLFKLGDVDLGYCITSHKFQGETINEEFNIYDTERMSFECLL